jgi:hypothetical protein
MSRTHTATTLPKRIPSVSDADRDLAIALGARKTGRAMARTMEPRLARRFLALLDRTVAERQRMCRLARIPQDRIDWLRFED